MLLNSPWLFVILLPLTIVLMRHHGVLAYGSYRSTVIGLLLATLYIGGQAMWGLLPVHIGLVGLLLIIVLSDEVVSSLSHGRSPFFVYDMGLQLGLLLMIHPGVLLLYPFFIAKLKSIESGTIRHISALIAGSATVLLLFTMLFAHRSWEGITAYWSSWAIPLTSYRVPHWEVVLISVLLLLFLLVCSVALWLSMRSSTVRVRNAITYHLQLSWLLMALQLLFGLQNRFLLVYVLGVLFLCGTMVDYLITQKHFRWVLIPLSIILIASLVLTAQVQGHLSLF